MSFGTVGRAKRAEVPSVRAAMNFLEVPLNIAGHITQIQTMQTKDGTPDHVFENIFFYFQLGRQSCEELCWGLKKEEAMGSVVYAISPCGGRHRA